MAEYEAGSRATAALDTATKARQLMAQAELAAETKTNFLHSIRRLRKELEQLQLEKCVLEVESRDEQLHLLKMKKNEEIKVLLEEAQERDRIDALISPS